MSVKKSSHFNMMLKLCSMYPNRQPVKWSTFRFQFFLFIHPYFRSGHHGDPYKVSITSYRSLLKIKKYLCVQKIRGWCFTSCFTLEDQICDEISWRSGNFVTCTNKICLGPRWLLMQKSLNNHLSPEFRQPLNN